MTKRKLLASKLEQTTLQQAKVRGTTDKFWETWGRVATCSGGKLVFTALDAAPAARSPRPTERQVFTDGSASGKGGQAKAGWAVVAIDTSSPVEGTLESAQAGPVIPGTAMCTGTTNNVAELLALLKAMGGELRRCRTERTTINCDSMYAISTALGRIVVRKKSKNRWLQEAVRRMYCELVEYKGVYRVTLQHVPSHTGNVGNETVDAMAKTGATMTTTTDVTQEATRVFHGRKDGNNRIRVAAPTWQWRRQRNSRDVSKHVPAYRSGDLSIHDHG